MVEEPFFNGEDFALIDAAYAPIFIRLDVFKDLWGLLITEDLPKIHAWGQKLLSMPAVRSARVPELPELFRQLIHSRNGYLQNLLR